MGGHGCIHGLGEGGDCQSENVLYEIVCLACKKEAKVTSYIGESSRTGQAHPRFMEKERG